MADDQAQQTDAQAARRAAVEQAASTIVYLAVMFGVSYAILKRDTAVRLWRRMRTRPLPASEAAARRAVAELRRDLADIEHGGGPAPRGGRGLYQRGQL